MNIYPFIEAEKACRHNVKRACELLKVSRAAFYQHLAGRSRRDRADAELAEKITQIHGESRGRYGAPRVHAVLARRGHRHGRKRVARLMRSAGIAGRAPKRWRKTTIADPAAAAPPPGTACDARRFRRKQTSPGLLPELVLTRKLSSPG
ncbi:MAG TPA: IS3 family transposase [Streptosporangiaceae bacterium]|nr:IS3 family transposase [Streptosporangiaceae bacterium]